MDISPVKVVKSLITYIIIHTTIASAMWIVRPLHKHITNELDHYMRLHVKNAHKGCFNTCSICSRPQEKYRNRLEQQAVALASEL